MIRIITFSFLLATLSCTSNNKIVKEAEKTQQLTPENEAKNTDSITVGERINGDFNGDGKIETATLSIVKEGIFQEKPWILSVDFSDKQIPPILFECNREYSILINEGVLCGPEGDKISIFSPPLGGCTYNMRTYALENGEWNIIVPTFLVPTYCDEFSNEQLQERIFCEDGQLFFLETDADTGELVREKVSSK